MKKYQFLLLFSTLVHFNYLFAQAGTLDLSFGLEGISILETSQNGGICGVVVQQTGNILCVDNAPDFSAKYRQVGITQFNSKGELNNGFGTNGLVIKDSIDLGLFIPSNFVMQKDDKLVVGGARYAKDNIKYAGITRFLPNGNIDSKFNTNGSAILSGEIYEESFISGVQVQQDKKIIAIGTAFDTSFLNSNILLVRTLENGILDPDFGKKGITTFEFDKKEQLEELNYDFIVQPDNKVVLIATTIKQGLTIPIFSLFRFNTNGILDTLFGNKGRAISPVYGDIELLPSGQIVVIGRKEYLDENTDYIYLTRFESNGKIDATFGKNGILDYDLPYSNCWIGQSLQQPDNKVVTSIVYNYLDRSHIVLMRFLTNGKIDSTFGDNGSTIPITATATTDAKSFIASSTLALDSNNDIIALGGLRRFSYGYILARFKSGLNKVKVTNNFDIQEKFTIFPNPSSDKLNITLQKEDAIENAEIFFFNALGAVIYKGKINNNATIDCCNWSSGLYTYRITDAQAQVLQVGKWIKM